MAGLVRFLAHIFPAESRIFILTTPPPFMSVTPLCRKEQPDRCMQMTAYVLLLLKHQMQV
jgi:hypothetical protein